MSLNKPHSKPRRTDKLNGNELIFRNEQYIDFKIAQLAKKYKIEFDNSANYDKYCTKKERDNYRYIILRDIVAKNGLEFKNIVELLEKLAEYAICYFAVLNNPNALEYVPRYYRDKEICTVAIALSDKGKRGNVAELIPTKLKAEKGNEIKELVDYYDGKINLKDLSNNQFKSKSDVRLIGTIGSFKEVSKKEISHKIGFINYNMGIIDYCRTRHNELSTNNQN